MKIALILNDDFSMFQFRGGLIKALVARGCEVTCIVPDGPYVPKLNALGARCITMPIARFLSPFADLKFAWNIYMICKREKFDLVHTMTIKPNIFATFAARFAGIPRIVGLVSGIGFLGSGKGLRNKIAMALYARAGKILDAVWFQNKDDLDFFVVHKLLSQQKGIVIRGSGVNLDEFKSGVVSADELKQLKDELSIPEQSKIVMMIAARCIWSKGVREFLEASKALKASFPEWTFVMLAPFDRGSPDSVKPADLEAYRSENLKIVSDFRHDVRRFAALSDIMVLASFYREGVPRSLLEAMAMSKPIVTTDNPGCRELVKDGENGFLIPVRDSDALVKALRKLCTDEGLRERMGRNSRKLTEQEFSEELVAKRVISELYLLN